MSLEMENGYSSPIPRTEKYADNPMKRALPFQGKVIGITGISGQKVIRTAHASPTGLKYLFAIKRGSKNMIKCMKMYRQKECKQRNGKLEF